MSGYAPRPGCPRCGETDDLFTVAVPGGYGNIVACLKCRWTGWEHELLTSSEARLEGRLHRMGL